MGRHRKPSSLKRRFAVAAPAVLAAGLLSGASPHTTPVALDDTNPGFGPMRISGPIALPTDLSYRVVDGEPIPKKYVPVTVTPPEHHTETTATTPPKAEAAAPSPSESTATTQATPTPPPTQAPPVSQPGESFLEKVVKAAESQIGLPYVYGGETPGVDFDCSGLTQWAYSVAGASIPRVANDQFNAMHMVSEAEAVPGDLVFFHDSSDLSSYVYHVGIYIGGGMMVVAPAPGNNIQIQSYSWGGDTVSFGALG